MPILLNVAAVLGCASFSWVYIHGDSRTCRLPTLLSYLGYIHF